MIFLLMIPVIILLLIVVIWIRNDLVHNERHRIITLIYELSLNDLEKTKSDKGLNNWRFELFHTISSAKMVFQFWKPVKSFYKNHPCLKEKVKEEKV